MLRQQLATEQKVATTHALINQLGDERVRQLNTKQAVVLAQIQLERQRQLNAVPQALQGDARSRVVAQINQEFDLRIETERRLVVGVALMLDIFRRIGYKRLRR